jgi:hypothetical protein
MQYINNDNILFFTKYHNMKAKGGVEVTNRAL